MRTSVKILAAVILFLFIATTFIWYVALREDTRGTLTVSFLDVGEGDAVLVTAPSGRRILIDGGPDDSVLRQLGEVMPFYQRSLDLVIATALTPGKAGGLSSVLSRYDVPLIVRSAANSNAPQVQPFTGAVASEEAAGAHLFIAKRGDVLDLGSTGSPQAEHTVIEVFSPDRDASQMSPSDGCLMLKLVYGNTAFFFACGSSALESYLATLDGSKLKSDVLLATGGDPELFVGFVSPQFAIVPCGSNATSSAFSKLDSQTLDTCDGTITFVSDGQAIVQR